MKIDIHRLSVLRNICLYINVYKYLLKCTLFVQKLSKLKVINKLRLKTSVYAWKVKEFWSEFLKCI